MTAIESANSLTQPKAWYRLAPLWQGGEEIIQQGLPHSQLAPLWQMLILGDGSPTKQVQLLTGEPTEVDVIDMSTVGMDSDNAPDQIQAVPGPRVRRQVWVRTASGQRLYYAASWWEASQVDEYLQNRAVPIWASLISQRKELYRDLQGIHYGHSAALEAGFGVSGAFWGRHYLFWHHGQPLTMIYEVFSPYLAKYLGPMQIG